VTKKYRRKLSPFAIVILPWLIGLQTTHAEHTPIMEDASPNQSNEPEYSGWQLYMDNDLFINNNKDRDYTGGFALTLSGAKTRDYWFSIHGWLATIDRLAGMTTLHEKPAALKKHSVEIGTTLFTPKNINQKQPVADDHPYANLLFLAYSRQSIFPHSGLLYQSALSVGFLGLPTGKWLQSALHSMVGSSAPKGWDNQISNGGEPTFHYSAGVQKTLLSMRSGKMGLDFLSGIEGGIGYSTDIAGSLKFRWGKINSSWWAFTPHQSDYISLGSTDSSAPLARNTSELFLWGGVSTKYQLYNAILQGQFRHSAVTFNSRELNHLISEGWLGITHKRIDGWGISFVVRARSRVIEDTNASSPVWGSFIFSHSL
jgi:hypothetical protein